MKCRSCNAPLEDVFLDLGSAPPSNAYLTADAMLAPESWFPLKLFTCANCFLVQVDEVQHHAALFAPDYAYYSSVSRSWLEHARRYVEHAVATLRLDRSSKVVEVASNDGYLLQYVAAAGIPCLGIEPTAGTAAVARSRGIETLCEFFSLALGRRLAAERGPADLVIANNVLAHVPDLNNFVAGIAALLAPAGVFTAEFPHLQQMVAQRQFDTAYHEHFSYFSLHSLQRVMHAHGLRIWHVQSLPTHGGSLRIWASHQGSDHDERAAVAELLAAEAAAGMTKLAYYGGFQLQADTIKNNLLAFLIEQKRAGRKVAGYGAAAKGNTLLNYAGVRPDLIPYVVDASPHKQGLHLPGSRIPVADESRIREDRPDLVLLLPWNLREEITSQLSYIREWGGRFVTAIPRMEVF
jgi:2-polyprenyl-3-methyl-5-hydroxy-6-metoxy-1,4-benzoquinol methylase